MIEMSLKLHFTNVLSTSQFTPIAIYFRKYFMHSYLYFIIRFGEFKL